MASQPGGGGEGVRGFFGGDARTLKTLPCTIAAHTPYLSE